MKKLFALLLTVLMLMSLTGVAVIAAGGTEGGENSDTQPIIWRFNNEEMIELWNSKSYNTNPSELIDGVMHTEYDEAQPVDDHFYRTQGQTGAMPEEYQFSLTDYPYIKVKYKHSGSASAIRLLLWNDTSAQPDPYVEFNSGTTDTWHTASVDLTSAAVSGGTATGNLTRFSMWFWNFWTAGSSDIEYIAFFHKDDKKSWEEFDTVDGVASTTAGTSDKFLPYSSVAEQLIAAAKTEAQNYSDVIKSADEAKAVAKAAAEKAVADSRLDASQVSFTIGEAKYITGGYGVNIEFAVGEKECRSFVKGEIAVEDSISEPIIWRFDNEEMIELWNSKSYNTNPSELIDGVMHTEYDEAQPVDDHFYRTQGQTGEIPEEYQFSLSDYPYIKVKYKHSGSAGTIRLLLWNDTSAQPDPYVEFNTGTTDTWHTASVDLTSTAVSGGTATGNLTRFSMWFWNYETAGSSDIEYIAFFHKYDKKAWEEFDTVDGVASTTAGTSDKFLPYYNEINAIADAGATAVAADTNAYSGYDKAEQSIKAKFEAEAVKLGNVDADDITVTVQTVTKAEPKATYKVTVSAGPVEARVIASKTVTVNVRTSVVWHYGNPEFVDKIAHTGHIKLSLRSEQEKTYMHAQATVAAGGDLGGDNFNFTYSDIDKDQSIELSEYPVIAIRYRSSKAGFIQLYYGTDVTGNSSADAKYYIDSSHIKSEEWTTKYIDVNDPSTANLHGNWAGELKFLRSDYMRFDYTANDYIDFDYFGFFATMEDAQAYVQKAEGDTAKVAAAALAAKNSFDSCKGHVSNKEDAEGIINDILSDVPADVTTRVELLDYVAHDPTVKDDDVGSYKFKVFFANGPFNNAVVQYIDVVLKFMPEAQFTSLGAQIREGVENGAPQGLRFGTKINKILWKDVDVTNVSYGTIVIPARLLTGELTLETQYAKDVPAVNKFKETDTEVTFTAVVTNIPDSEFNTQIAARAYAKYTFAGEEHIVYSDFTKIRSINDVLNLAGDGYEEYPQLLGNITYDRETWMTPFWEGDTVYHELFWPVMPEGADEDDALVVDLLYPISDVIVVKNGTHTKDYHEGKDYYVNYLGQLVIPAGSEIRRMPFNEYISDTRKSVVSVMDGTQYQYIRIEPDLPEYADYVGKYLYFTEGANIQMSHQYSISYRHAAEWDENAPLPSYEENALPRTRQMLANKEAINIGYFGDSITAGGNQTGPYGVSPNTIHWRNAVAQTLEAMYGYTEDGNRIHVRSEAMGGTGSGWGRNGGTTLIPGDPTIPNGYAAHRFAANPSYSNNGGIPDLFVLAFGMNDESLAPETFKDNISNIVDQILTLNPNCEFVLVSTSMPNSLVEKMSNREQFEAALEEVVIEKRAKGVNIDVANISSMHKHFLTIKPYRDMTGNNVNHQNDMLSRLYAQTVVTTIAGDCK